MWGLISSYFGRHKPKDFLFMDFDASGIQKHHRHIKNIIGVALLKTTASGLVAKSCVRARGAEKARAKRAISSQDRGPGLATLETAFRLGRTNGLLKQ
ncbi:MAG: hypothetical protein ACU0FH_20495 [Heliomarina sp.]|uniref:hypothetical protein n=1 Tax=Heliomarina sp. TaxID=2917556 RepID=UPI0040584911